MKSSQFAKNDIKHYVLKYIENHTSFFKGKTVVDVPAGNGITAEALQQIGAKVICFDLFPDYFKAPGLSCEFADLAEKLPLENESVDVIICQEGIEHLSDQFSAFNEWNRVLKKGGSLFISTPNYGNLRGKLSYLISESEHYKKKAPLTKWNSFWMKSDDGNRTYFGHLFLLSASKMDVLAELNGFSNFEHIQTERNSTSQALLFLFYPMIRIQHFFLSRKLKKTSKDQHTLRDSLAKLKQTRSIALLTSGHLFFHYKKQNTYAETINEIQSVHQSFGKT